MSKTIAVILNTEPEWGGEHQYAHTLMECLAESKDVELVAICNNRYWRNWCRQHQIRVLNVMWPFLTEKEREYHLRFPLYSRIYIMYMTEFGRKIRQEKIDAVLCTTQGAFIPNLDIKVIEPVHDLMHRYEGRFPEIRNDYEVRERLFASKAKYAWCILTDSKLGKRQFEESYAKYIRKRKLHIVSLPFVAPKHLVECEEEYIDTPEKYVFYPAQFWQHKNHMNLLKAIDLLVQDIPDIHLLLVGAEKNGMKNVKRYILEHGLTDHVTITGFVSDGSLAYLYRHAVGMVMPSYFGPTNIPPLEAMALGCPTAVSNKYAMPEQVGDAGLLFNPDSPEEIAGCIKQMWCDESLRQEMIRKGNRQIKKWTLESFAGRFHRIIKNV